MGKEKVMAVIDYGAVAFKNGVKLNGDDLFMDMLEAVGWVDVPRKRYHDCDCTDERGFSDCDECPRRTVGHYEDIDGKLCDYTEGDCRGTRISHVDKLDRNYYAYIGDKDLTFGFYKRWCAISYHGERQKSVYAAGGESKMSVTQKIGDVSYKIRWVCGGVLHFSMVYKGDYYHVVYGYGIDPDARIWRKVKYRYLGKKRARKVDNLYRRIRESYKPR